MFPITFNAFGDILAFAQLAYGIAKALNDARGASADYKRLIHDLNAIGAVVTEAHRVADASKDDHIKAAILDEVCLCNAAVAEVGKLLPGFASLASSAPNESRRARVQGALKKIRWHLMKSSDAAALADRFHVSHQRLDSYIDCIVHRLVDDGFRRLSGELRGFSDVSEHDHRFTREEVARSTSRMSEELHKQSELTSRGHSQLQQSIDDAKETIVTSIRLLLAQSSRESCDFRREIATLVSKHFATSSQRDVTLAERTSDAMITRLRAQLSASDAERQRFMTLLVSIAVFGAAFVARNDIDPRWRATTLWATICAALVIFTRLQTTLPASISENTIIFIDALGERIPLGLQICDSLEHFHTFLVSFYTTRNRKGHTFVRQKMYEIYSAGSSQAITSDHWASDVIQGAVIEMGILLLRRALGQLPSLRCPYCGAVNDSIIEAEDYNCMGCTRHFTAITRETEVPESQYPATEESSHSQSPQFDANHQIMSDDMHNESVDDMDVKSHTDECPSPTPASEHQGGNDSREPENLHDFIRLVLITEFTASSSIQTAVDSPVTRQGGFQWAKPKSSSDVESPHPSPQRAEHTNTASSSSSTPTSNISQGTLQQQTLTPTTSGSNGTARNGAPRPTRQESSDNLKSFKVSLEDPAWKVLPVALRKYKINNDDWQNYAMFICYGPPNNRVERCLSYDEKPLPLFQKLKDASENPVFMLKHIKDIRSPIAVAQQKQAARKASNASSTNANSSTSSTSGSTVRGGAQGHGRTLSRPPRLQVHAAQAATEPPLNTGGSAATGWPELMSPAGGDSRPRLHTSASNSNLSINETAPKSAVAPVTASSAGGDGLGHGSGHGKEREQPVGGENVSYSVAIYPYMAEQEDEFDVVVGDTFVIISRVRGWWVVQRDPQGTGTVDSDPSKQGWVPAGCLLETRIPIARAITPSHNYNSNSNPGSTPSSPTDGVAGGINARTPILPLHIVSTSFPGYALMDYKKKGDEELDLGKDDALRVFKRYNHWSYAVKEDGGERGWVPSWYIGKVAANAQTLATPAVGDSRDRSVSVGGGGGGGGGGGANITLDSEAGFDRSAGVGLGSGMGGMPAVSPMSSAFPPQQGGSRTSTYL